MNDQGQPITLPTYPREITTHRAGAGCGDRQVVQTVTPGNYQLFLPAGHDESHGPMMTVHLQDGPIRAGWNGATLEAVLAVLIDQAEQYQRGPSACSETANAITFMQSAMRELHRRTRRLVAEAAPKPDLTYVPLHEEHLDDRHDSL